jgi:DUF971 family protein
MTDKKLPTKINLHTQSKTLVLEYGGEQFELSGEYLRVHSPSAEVRGHGRGQETLQAGKLHVGITAIEPVGRYAIKLIFSDGHDSGIFTWDYLYDLCIHHDQYWDSYLQKLHQESKTRDPDVSVIKLDL